jgi:hypothetical protein
VFLLAQWAPLNDYEITAFVFNLFSGHDDDSDMESDDSDDQLSGLS